MRTPAALVTVALALGAGAYAPPAGADDPAPIDSCATIAAPGSYALVQNLTAAGDCLIIADDFVTIDLNGWTIAGDGTGSGIASDERRGVAVRNGTVTGFEFGINLEGSDARVEEVRAIGNGVGVIVAGEGSTVSGNTASENEGDGLVVTCPSNVLENTATGNAGENLVLDGAGCNNFQNLAP